MCSVKNARRNFPLQLVREIENLTHRKLKSKLTIYESGVPQKLLIKDCFCERLYLGRNIDNCVFFEMWVIFSNSRPWGVQCNWAFTLTTQTDKKLFFLYKTTKQNYWSQPIKIYTPRKKSIKPYRFQTKYLKAKKAVGKLEFEHAQPCRDPSYKSLQAFVESVPTKAEKNFLHRLYRWYISDCA